MRSNLLFEGLKVIATLILILIPIKFFPNKTEINKEVFAIAILILAYLIYLFIKFLFAIFFPIRVSSSISNNKSPHKLSTHIVYSKKEKIEKEIKLELKIQYKYLSKIVHIFIKWLLKDTDIYLTIETSEKTVFLRGDSYKIIKPFNTQNAKINLNDKINKIMDINDLKEKNEEGYNIYIRVNKGEKVSVETNILSNLIVENRNNNNFKAFLLKVLTRKTKIDKNNFDHKIYIYEQE